ncbi:cell division inhibitor FtsA [Secundilactobacillus oryzae JCM 18671]|uniref:Cell division protein FtsA n=1 Tax=Secundilactobacillus oryzae JCM 18671 TaxID=1291743 RepID=A0A081BGL9_9LACO|nr:cell division protein FtsA [Secundilactobacillus oryzae]GAK47187.1 cell division inhibitor FtsA [Secundilactobacillus oryzae JCM 18671]
MDNSGMFVGLDIGTTSIKVIVAEYVKGQMNVIGVGNERSEGLNRGVIVDIDKAVAAIKSAVRQAEEKASIQIQNVVVGIPANMLSIEPCNGMITIDDQAREINDRDVQNVSLSALTQNLPPEREVIDLQAEEFVVDGFDGIKDPRAMVGVRLEMHGMLFTGAKTVIHNTRKAVEQAGLTIETMIVSPLAQGKTIMSDGEQDFGTILIDLGGGETTAAVIHDHRLKYTYTDDEGGAYITRDISVVLNTSLENAEKIKRDYGYADSLQASDDNEFPVEVVGQSQPTQISERYLAEIIEARVGQIFENVKQHLTGIGALKLPGGIVLTGGVAALPGIADLAADTFDVNVRVYIPDQMGLRHPSFTQALSLVTYRGQMSEIDLLVKSAANGTGTIQFNNSDQFAAPQQSGKRRREQPAKKERPKKEKKDRAQGIKSFFSDFFD